MSFHRVLVVSIPPADARIEAVLSDCELEWTRSQAAALAACRERTFDVAVVSVIVPNAFSIAKALREAAPDLPLICVRAFDERHVLTHATLGGLRLAAEAVGARGFVDFFDFPEDERGTAAIHARIDAAISARGG